MDIKLPFGLRLLDAYSLAERYEFRAYNMGRMAGMDLAQRLLPDKVALVSARDAARYELEARDLLPPYESYFNS